SFGQRSMIRFDKVQANLALPASTFDFQVPQGADVLKQ
ncbi:MAG: outer membrane lipoprotein carrier protein LolA, partial [Giesbergeria sp.]